MLKCGNSGNDKLICMDDCYLGIIYNDHKHYQQKNRLSIKFIIPFILYLFV